MADLGATWWQGRHDLLRPSTKVSAKLAHRQLSNWPVKKTDTHADTQTRSVIVLVDNPLLNKSHNYSGLLWIAREIFKIQTFPQPIGTNCTARKWVVLSYRVVNRNLSCENADGHRLRRARWIGRGQCLSSVITSNAASHPLT